jgi:hypothetical protein
MFSAQAVCCSSIFVLWCGSHYSRHFWGALNDVAWNKKKKKQDSSSTYSDAGSLTCRLVDIATATVCAAMHRAPRPMNTRSGNQCRCVSFRSQGEADNKKRTRSLPQEARRVWHAPRPMKAHIVSCTGALDRLLSKESMASCVSEAASRDSFRRSSLIQIH